MPYEIITDENGKLVLLERNKVKRGGAMRDGKLERFIALQPVTKEYEVFDTCSHATCYLEMVGGGKIYRLTYHHHTSQGETEILPQSEFLKEVAK